MQEMQETQDQCLGGEYPLEQEMATHSSILAWKLPWTEKPGRLQSMELQRMEHDRACTYNAGRSKKKNKQKQDMEAEGRQCSLLTQSGINH